MDKYEYKVRVDEIKELIARGEYSQAAEIADTIDWRRVKSVVTLCVVSDLYKINRRYEDARDVLYLAYERRPGGKSICYALCELCVKTEEFVQAVNFYKEFVQIAPKDPGRYVLQYKIYEAQDVSLEERISVLEELKKRDYREKWAYELAYLYHRVGLATKCVEECDELILWFGEGKYVIKAMELKMLHEPLTPTQQVRYDHRFEKGTQRSGPHASEKIPEAKAEEAAVAYESAEETDAGYESAEEADTGYGAEEEITSEYEPSEEEIASDYGPSEEETSSDYDLSGEAAGEYAAAEVPSQEAEDFDIHVKTVDVSQYNTINLQAELAEGLREILAQDLEQGTEQPETVLSEPEKPEAVSAVQEEAVNTESGESKEFGTAVYPSEPPKKYAEILAQESDGQIRLVVPESKDALEKQITGQINMDDIMAEMLAEWERMKKENEEKRKEEVRQHVLQNTGEMFTKFEAAIRDGLLEQLESGAGLEDSSAEEEPRAWEETSLEELEGSKEEASMVTEPLDESCDSSVEELYEEPADCDIPETDSESSDFDGGEAYEELPEGDFRDEDAGEEEIFEDTGDWMTEDSPEETEETGEEIPETEEFPETIEEIPETEEFSETIEEIPETEEFSEEVPGKERRAVGERAKVRALTREEEELYGPFIRNRSSREKLIKAVDNVSLAAYTGNIIITGDEIPEALALAKNMIRELQLTDSNFSGKVAKVSGKGLNSKNVEETLTHLNNGALIVEGASEMKENTVGRIHKILQQENLGIVMILIDTKKAMAKLLDTYRELQESFTARIDLEAMSNDMLVEAGKRYAREQEYSIDDLGILAFHTRIEELQTSSHRVSVAEAKTIVDEAIEHANRKTPRHFFDVLLGKRYDDEDMIILTEKDFV